MEGNGRNKTLVGLSSGQAEEYKLPTLNLDSVIAFYIIAREGNFSTVAEKLYTSEQALSRRIKSLEEQVGSKLFMIKNKKLNLTSAGEVIYQYGEYLHRQVLTFEVRLRRLQVMNLNIGCAETLSLVVACAVSAFKQKFPHVTFKLASGPSYKIAEETSALKHDVSFIYDIEVNNSKLRKITLSNSERMVFVGSPTINTTLRKIMSLAEIAEHFLIIGVDGAGSRDIAFREFARLGIKIPEESITVTGLESGVGLAERGSGVLVTHPSRVHDAISKGALRVMASIDNVGIVAIRPINEDINSAEKALISEVKDSLERYRIAE
jgi:DNA-binding transcriptional LysR family regulator